LPVTDKLTAEAILMRCGAKLSIFQGTTRIRPAEKSTTQGGRARTATVSEDCLEAGRRR
jgi:hypothetical protein